MREFLAHAVDFYLAPAVGLVMATDIKQVA
jgi:hypothetical protein